MLSIVDASLAPVPQEDLDCSLIRKIQRESNAYTLNIWRDQLWPRKVVETIPGGNN